MVSPSESHRVLSTYKQAYKNVQTPKQEREDSPGPLNSAREYILAT